MPIKRNSQIQKSYFIKPLFKFRVFILFVLFEYHWVILKGLRLEYICVKFPLSIAKLEPHYYLRHVHECDIVGFHWSLCAKTVLDYSYDKVPVPYRTVITKFHQTELVWRIFSLENWNKFWCLIGSLTCEHFWKTSVHWFYFLLLPNNTIDILSEI